MAFQKGHAKLGGRVKGKPNAATADIKALAQKHGSDAIRKLAELAESADSDAAKIAACRELLDRGYGKATQPLSGDGDKPPGGVAFIWLPSSE